MLNILIKTYVLFTAMLFILAGACLIMISSAPASLSLFYFLTETFAYITASTAAFDSASDATISSLLSLAYFFLYACLLLYTGIKLMGRHRPESLRIFAIVISGLLIAILLNTYASGVQKLGDMGILVFSFLILICLPLPWALKAIQPK